MSDPTLSKGIWTIPKDPDDNRFYRANVQKDLDDSLTTIASVQTIVQGVTVSQPATFSGGDVVVKLTGLDVTVNPVNFCTFRITCTNGEIFDRTIWFVREDH